MTETNQLPSSEREAFEAFAQNCPMGKYSITRRGDGYDSSHTQLMWDAWQARAQVHPAQAEVTDAEIDAVTRQQWGEQLGVMFQAHRAYARAILALRPSTAPNLSCKSVQARLATQWGYVRPAAVPMTDEVFDLICNAIDKADTISMEGDYMLDSDDCIAVVRVMQALLSAHHGITAQAKKETP